MRNIIFDVFPMPSDYDNWDKHIEYAMLEPDVAEEIRAKHAMRYVFYKRR